MTDRDIINKVVQNTNWNERVVLSLSILQTIKILELRKLWADLDEAKMETTYFDDFDADDVLVVPVRGRLGEYS